MPTSDPDPATTALPFGMQPDDHITIAALDAMRQHSRSHDDDDFVSLCCIQAALGAARPLIVQAERQRIRDGSQRWAGMPRTYIVPADLLDGDGDA